MSDEIAIAKELYKKFGLKKASFIAFDNMQKATGEEETEYWLRVINRIALLDIAGDDFFETKSQTS
ncbi:hypothetical protein GCM10011332_21440 [Terasakiella brassicae]|uniref:Uncharacterized protein n=1 Tax=Terasakiella brassicae TaxID=1634917 RepID=A0A917C3F4_9PROT|nr:hypothetical protein [Terasakiella brassicae]GGF67055.1 hypothetical protein GCM10011332_21440 [Terasakiella brassicae]